MIKPTCDKCGDELVKFGGLAFSAPDTKPDGSAFRCVDKYHLCVVCFESFKSWLDYERDATTQVLLTKEQWGKAQRAGGYSIRQYEPGKYWLENEHGEGMETSEEKITAMLKEFFDREF